MSSLWISLLLFWKHPRCGEPCTVGKPHCFKARLMSIALLIPVYTTPSLILLCMSPEIFPLGLETFSQLIYEDDYGAVRHMKIFLDVIGLHGIIQADSFFPRRKTSMRRRSATSPDFRIGASCWTPLGISCRSKSSWPTWWACYTSVDIFFLSNVSIDCLFAQETMAMNKINVFHWHIVDDPSFPYMSKTFPQLSQQVGAWFCLLFLYVVLFSSAEPVFCCWRAGRERSTHTHTCTRPLTWRWWSNLPVWEAFVSSQNLTRQGTLSLGAKVSLTEVFLTSWMHRLHSLVPPPSGQASLLTPCYSESKPSGSFGPVNPILNTTYTFMTQFFKEVSAVFPDGYVHLGGDEVDFSCWWDWTGRWSASLQRQ